MAKSIAVKPKKRGRPATGRDPFIGIRLPESLLSEIADWSDNHEAASRSEAIRRLVELGLTVSQPDKHTSPKAAAKASEMAGERIDELTDPALPEEEQRARKRRLIKGPQEFREMRGGQAKRKK